MPSTPFGLRVRTKTGVIKITNLTEQSSLAELKAAISTQANIDCSYVKILKGFPPKSLDTTNESETLISHSIVNGELLTIEECKDDSRTSSVTSSHKETSTTTEGVLLRKVVPANNSCLFTSIHYVMSNGIYDLDCQESMRQFIAQTVRNDTINFNEAILGKTNSEYCKWIMVVKKPFIFIKKF
jgi:ubiquitin thioesterase OTU1